MSEPYQVTVNNIGTIYDGTDRVRARDVFLEYIKLVSEPGNRCTLESVIFFEDGEPLHEWHPEIDLAPSALGRAHGLKTFDMAIPQEWFKDASARVGRNISGHVVWNYPERDSEGNCPHGHIFGEPYGLTQLGREAIELMASPEGSVFKHSPGGE